MSSKVLENDGEAQELDQSHRQCPQEQRYVLYDLDRYPLLASSTPEPTTSGATNIPGKRPPAQATMGPVPSNSSNQPPLRDTDSSTSDTFHTAPESPQQSSSSIANASESEPAPDRAFLPRRHPDYGRREHAAVWSPATVPRSHFHSRGASNTSSSANQRYDRIEERFADLEGRIARLESERQTERRGSRGKETANDERSKSKRHEESSKNEGADEI